MIIPLMDEVEKPCCPCSDCCAYVLNGWTGNRTSLAVPDRARLVVLSLSRDTTVFSRTRQLVRRWLYEGAVQGRGAWVSGGQT